MQFGFTSTSFRQIRSLEKIIEIAVRAEIDCIEWGGDIHVRSVADAKRAKELCDKAGVRINSYGSYYRVGCKNAEEWKKICETASAMGAKAVRVWLGKADSEKTDEGTYINPLFWVPNAILTGKPTRYEVTLEALERMA